MILYYIIYRGSQGVQTIIQLAIANENVGVCIVLYLIISLLYY